LRVTGCALRVARYEVRVASCVLPVARYEVRIAGVFDCGFRIADAR